MKRGWRIHPHCRKDQDDGDKPSSGVVYDFNSAAEATTEIGSDGGSLNLDDGYGSRFTLEVPAGALAVSTEVSLMGIVSTSDFPEAFRVLTAVRLQPEGLTFDGSARLTIELPESSRSGYPTVAFLSNDDGTRLTFLPLSGTDPLAAALSDPSVRVDLVHFSVAGVAEAYDGTGFPDLPADATAEERAMAAIAERMAELLNAGSDILADQEIADALSDWLSNPDDGLAPRLGDAGASSEDLTIEALRRLTTGEASRFLDQARGYLPDIELEILEADLMDEASDLFESYRSELTVAACDEETRDAQLALNALRLLIDDFDDGALASDFADRSFFCGYEVVFQSLFAPAFATSEPLVIPYHFELQDGGSFYGTGDELSSEYEIPAPQITVENGTILSDAPDFLITPGLIGPASLSVQVADQPEVTVDILWVPSFLGTYTFAARGVASDCVYDEDEGAGGRTYGGVATSQTLIGATETSAIVQFILTGAPLTSFSATATFTSINAGQAVGTLNGELSYAYQEYDPEDQQYYPVSGGGDFNGTITATNTTRVATTSYVGSSNWCSSFVGTATITGQ